MSAWRWIELTCDAPDCGENFREHMPTGSFESARREAKSAGWSRAKVGGSFEDRCPGHIGGSSSSEVSDGQ